MPISRTTVSHMAVHASRDRTCSACPSAWAIHNVLESAARQAVVINASSNISAGRAAPRRRRANAVPGSSLAARRTIFGSAAWSGKRRRHCLGRSDAVHRCGCSRRLPRSGFSECHESDVRAGKALNNSPEAHFRYQRGGLGCVKPCGFPVCLFRPIFKLAFHPE